MIDSLMLTTQSPTTQAGDQQDPVHRLLIKRVAVLGAGVMGAQIAAYFVNAGYEVFLYDLVGTKSNRNMLSQDAVRDLVKMSPAPFALNDEAKFIHPKNYEHDLDALHTCDFIIEAIAERLDWKQDLYEKIAPHLHDKAILCSNTSGLRIDTLAKSLPRSLQSRFCGVHFFNPPRYLPLIELVPGPKNSAEFLDKLETFLVSSLGKKVVRTKDTPNFIGNRIGVFSLLIALHYAEVYDLRLDVVDVLTGTLIGHPKSATLRTLDIVGLDTFAHVVSTMANDLKEDPWHEYFKIPDWLAILCERGSLGQKSGIGIYKRDKDQILVFDRKDSEYRPVTAQVHKDVLEIMKITDPVIKFKRLHGSEKREAKFLWSYHRDLWQYAAYHLNQIAESVRDVDQSMRWGFAWKQGPFEQWQSAGWSIMTALMAEDIEKGKALVTLPLPEWVHRDKHQGAYSEVGAYSPDKQSFIPRRHLPVYQRQLFPEPMPCEHFDEGVTLYEDKFVRLWQQSDPIAILSFKSKMASISRGVLHGISQALPIAIEKAKALVIWQRDCSHFSVGADITEFLDCMNRKDFSAMEQTLREFQAMCLSIRYSPIPVVAALRGYVFGGGCELAMHCDRRVAHTETFMGLVEAGLGLVPAGGGCKEWVSRASREAGTGDPMPFIRKAFELVAYGKASTSAQEAQKMGYLESVDTILMHPDELLFVAKQIAHALALSNYTPPRPELIQTVGENGWAQLQTTLINLAEGGFASAHDYLIADHLAKIFSGGMITSGSYVDEAWLLRLERESFIELASTAESKARVEHMLATGKSLRN
jgi:3-hydroxyacyl-CoA dehydrogenase